MEEASLIVDGAAQPFLPGDTLAACLLRSGRFGLRRTQRGEPRGVYCGIGVCNDCLVTVDGAPNVRACVTAAQPGMIVSLAGSAR